MDISNITSYLLPAAVGGFFAWRFYKARHFRSRLPSLLKDGAIIVDVRSRSEFASGSNKNSINIPLDELDSSIHRLDKSKCIILCCASGTRSGIGVSKLKSLGFGNVINGGSWGNTIQ